MLQMNFPDLVAVNVAAIHDRAYVGQENGEG